MNPFGDPCVECEKYEDAAWFRTLQQIAVLAPYATYPEIKKMLQAIASHLGHPDNISGLEHLLLHLMMHEQENNRG